MIKSNQIFKDISNISIGVDIEDISRFKNLDRIRDKNFLNNTFTEKEIDYCFSKKVWAQHLAVRFAAKEAIIKAINSLMEKAPALNMIEIKNNKNGMPLVILGWYNIKVSLSHCNDKAIAFAVVEKK